MSSNVKEPNNEEPVAEIQIVHKGRGVEIRYRGYPDISFVEADLAVALARIHQDRINASKTAILPPGNIVVPKGGRG
jgi:hypothetical protein